MLTALLQSRRVDCCRRIHAALFENQIQSIDFETGDTMRALSFIAIAALSLPIAANAEKLSYRNVDLAYFISAEIDDNGGNVSGNGFEVRGMLPIQDNFFAFAEFRALNFDFDVDTTRFLVGGGGHWPLANNVDIIGRVGVVSLKLDAGSSDQSDTSLFIGGRVRAMISPQLELEGGLEYYPVDVGAIKNETVLIGEARYHFNPQWSAGVLVNFGSDTNNFGIQGRFNF
jgi:hypothetical protein